MKTISETKCVVCGKIIISRYKKCKYCSRTCFYKGLRKEKVLTDIEKVRRHILKVNKRCPDCDKLINPASTHCHEHVVYPSRKLEHHPNWKGGRFTEKSRGYIRVNVGNGKTKREHCLVWERTHGKSLPHGWIVHHLNGIKTDNRPENLVGMPRKQHGRIPSGHRTFVEALQERIRQLEQLRFNL